MTRVQKTFSFDAISAEICDRLIAKGTNISEIFQTTLKQMDIDNPDASIINKEIIAISEQKIKMLEREAILKSRLEEIHHHEAEREIRQNEDALKETEENIKNGNSKEEKEKHWEKIKKIQREAFNNYAVKPEDADKIFHDFFENLKNGKIKNLVEFMAVLNIHKKEKTKRQEEFCK
jgi:hypothetical protein